MGFCIFAAKKRFYYFEARNVRSLSASLSSFSDWSKLPLRYAMPASLILSLAPWAPEALGSALARRTLRDLTSASMRAMRGSTDFAAGGGGGGGADWWDSVASLSGASWLSLPRESTGIEVPASLSAFFTLPSALPLSPGKMAVPSSVKQVP